MPSNISTMMLLNSQRKITVTRVFPMPFAEIKYKQKIRCPVRWISTHSFVSRSVPTRALRTHCSAPQNKLLCPCSSYGHRELVETRRFSRFTTFHVLLVQGWFEVLVSVIAVCMKNGRSSFPKFWDTLKCTVYWYWSVYVYCWLQLSPTWNVHLCL